MVMSKEENAVKLLEERLDALRLLETSFVGPNGPTTHFLLTYTPPDLPCAEEEYQLTLRQLQEFFGLCSEVVDIAKAKVKPVPTEKASASHLNAEALRAALERILDIEGYGAPMIEVKCIAQKALEGQQCTSPPPAQVMPKIEQPGNAAALRAALEHISDNLALHVRCGRFVAPGDHVSFPIIEADAYIRDIRAALAAPPRNCDSFNRWETAKEVFEAENWQRLGHINPYLDVIKWLFALAEGGAK